MPPSPLGWYSNFFLKDSTDMSFFLTETSVVLFLYCLPPVTLQRVLHLGYQEAVQEGVALLLENILEK